MSRPLKEYTIEALFIYYSQWSGDTKRIDNLVAELKHRKTPKAKTLLNLIQNKKAPVIDIPNEHPVQVITPIAAITPVLPIDPVKNQRLVSMLDYLEQWDKLNRTPTFDVSDHQGSLIIWEHDLKGLPSISLDLSDSSGEIWMEVKRLHPSKPPSPSEDISVWLMISDNPKYNPTIIESIPDPEDPEKQIIFADETEIQKRVAEYIEGAWTKWATLEAPRRQTISIYDKLFNLLQTIETEGADSAQELVWGMGISQWIKDSKKIRYPVVSRLVEIDPMEPLIKAPFSKSG